MDGRKIGGYAALILMGLAMYFQLADSSEKLNTIPKSLHGTWKQIAWQASGFDEQEALDIGPTSFYRRGYKFDHPKYRLGNVVQVLLENDRQIDIVVQYPELGRGVGYAIVISDIPGVISLQSISGHSTRDGDRIYEYRNIASYERVNARN